MFPEILIVIAVVGLVYWFLSFCFKRSLSHGDVNRLHDGIMAGIRSEESLAAERRRDTATTDALAFLQKHRQSIAHAQAAALAKDHSPTGSRAAHDEADRAWRNIKKLAETQFGESAVNSACYRAGYR